MQITMRPMTAEEAWQHIMDNHSMYHRSLKNYGYTYRNFIPDVDVIREMFKKETLTPQILKNIKTRL